MPTPVATLDKMLEELIDLFEPVTSRLRSDYGFEADPSHLTMAGICRVCQATTTGDQS
jgi:hypothetical protein